MPVQQTPPEPQLPPDRPHFVFIEIGQRLHDPARFHQFLHARHAVVMRLDRRRIRRPARFDRVRINRALPQNPVPVQQSARFDDVLLHTHKLLADQVPLELRLPHVFERFQKFLARNGQSRPPRAPASRKYAPRTPSRPRASAPYPRRRRVLVCPQRPQAKRERDVESTPPLTKKNTFRSPTVRRISSSTKLIRCPAFQSLAQPQISNTKFSRIRTPCTVCTTSGWNCTP